MAAASGCDRAPSSHVRDDVAVSDVEQSDGRAIAPGEEKSVLANLPTKGQAGAATARVRARGQDRPARKPATAKTSTAKRAKASPTRARASTTPRSTSVEEAAPRQGFESDSNAASAPVQPPGGAELLGSAAEILAELAKGGLSSGERLLRDALSRLPGVR